MNADREVPGNEWMTGNSVPDIVASLYYRYGLFVASHPFKFISWAIFSFFLMSTPLWYLPLPGYLPQNYVNSIQNYSVPPPAPEGGIQLSPSSNPTPLWYQGPPRAYIQQVVIRSLVVPWERGLTVADSIRGPLSSVFRLSQIISDFQMKSNRSVTLSSECLLVEDVVRKFEKIPSLPHFNCLILSPADLWGRDAQALKEDPNVLLTIKSLKARNEGDTSVADILFGLPSKDVGLFSGSEHPRIVSYAITIALNRHSENFLSSLAEELKTKYPLHQPIDSPDGSIVHVYFPSRLSIWEFLILIFYGVLFSSIYFSVKKIQGLCSNFGLALSMMAALVSSVCLATSVSAHFGLRPLHSKAKFLYPVLAALVGFENSMALLRSVLSTPDHLDGKIRVAQGLAKEGWAMTKYFLSMITVVTISFFLFIPLVQEMCIYGSLVLMCDFYLQLVFFAAVISIDLKRSEGIDQRKVTTYLNPLLRYPQITPSSDMQLNASNNVYEGRTYVPNLHNRRGRTGIDRGEDRLAPPQSKPQKAKEMPRRLRFTYFVVRKRMFQRMLICIFIGWIAWMVYTSELVAHLTNPESFISGRKDLPSVIFSLRNRTVVSKGSPEDEAEELNSRIRFSSRTETRRDDFKFTKEYRENLNDSSFVHLKHKRRSFAKWLPVSHWPVLFGYYNISLRGHYLSILPPILLSVSVSPEEARKSANSLDPNTQEWLPQFEDAVDNDYMGENWSEESVIIPSSSGELLVAAILVIPAFVVVIYATIALYRCVCSRNYAEWRSSRWFGEDPAERTSQVIGEAVPLVLSGHNHDVECLSSDGSIVVSSCLGGVICAWDPTNGECISSIDRNRMRASVSSEGKSAASSPACKCEVFRERAVPDSLSNKRMNGCCIKAECRPDEWLQSFNSLPLLSSVLPDLTPTIETNFRSCSANSLSPSHRFDHIRQLYQDHSHHLKTGGLNKKCRESPCKRPFCPDYAHLSTPCVYEKPPSSTRHRRNASLGSVSRPEVALDRDRLRRTLSSHSETDPERPPLFDSSPVWCLDFTGGLLYLGTATGVIEVWDVFAPALKCAFDDLSGVGVTFVKVAGKRLVAVRLSGVVDVFNVQTNPPHTSRGSPDSGSWMVEGGEEVELAREHRIKAHQQPITVVNCAFDRVVTGSYDHTLKVLNVEEGRVMFTLHGHYGPITSSAMGVPLGGDGSMSVGITVDFGGAGDVIVSGSQDGTLCVWDFETGACVFSVQAHDGAVNSLTCTSSYILSLGADERLCVWERIRGHLLNTLIMTQMYCDSMVMLTNKLLITGQQGSLTVWDITVGEAVRVVRLGDRDRTIFVRHLLPVSGSVVCDYGNELRAVRLLVAEKLD